MAVKLKTAHDIELLREGGKRAAFIMKELVKAAVPGASSADLNTLAEKLIEEGGDRSAVLGYKPYGAKRPYPASICLSINDAVVHGIPNEEPFILKEGDIATIDLTLTHKGMVTDMAMTTPVGKIDKDAAQLLKSTKAALNLGIEAARAGNTTGHIGEAVQSYIAPLGFGIVEELAGHGVGYQVHEDPYVPNYGKAGEGEPLVPGMVIAIEPIVNEGTGKVFLDKDGYTYRTKDGKRSCHFEHTVLITENGPEILTQ